MAIRIVTDSTAYLPDDFVDQHQVRVAPLKVIFVDRVYKEGTELSPSEFYRLLKTAAHLPTTSQPSTGEFRDIYSELAAQGHPVWQ